MKPWFHRTVRFNLVGVRMPGYSRPSGFVITLRPATREGWVLSVIMAALILFCFTALPMLVGETIQDAGREWPTGLTFGLASLFITIVTAFAFSGPTPNGTDEEN
ncbi:hypothetical protein [Maricaulis sp.]|uniref:hypothetical protein n=1 Tax=Maricaulis sp. TaxID=1486257 RepID=UPI003A8FEB77